MPGAALAPIIGTALGSATTGAIIGAVIDTVAFGALASLLGRRGSPTGDRARGRIVSPIDPVAPHEIAYGSARKGGSVIWRGTSGNDDEFLWYVVAYQGRRTNDLVTFWQRGRSYNGPAGGSGAVTDPQFKDATGKDLLHQYERTGTPGQTAISQLVSAFPSKFTAADVGAEVTYVAYRCERDTSASAGTPSDPWFQGAPSEWSITGTWAWVYDATQDDTNGGTGPHRRDDPTTWAWSSNPIWCTRDYLADTKHGFGFDTLTEFDDAELIVEAGRCDELVAVPGGTETRYRLGGAMSTGNAKGDNLRQMLQSFAGVLVYSQGKVRLHCGYGEASTFTLRPEHLVDPQAVTVQYDRERRERFNWIGGTFFDNEQNWRQSQFPPRTNAQYVSDDNGEIRTQVDMPFVRDWYQAQRLALIELERSRLGGTLTALCKPQIYPDVAVWDVITYDDPETTVGPLEFRVTHLQIRQDGAIVLQAQRDDAGIYTPPETDYEERPS